MYGCEPYIQFSTLELFCIVAFAAAKAFFPSPATTGIAGGFSIRQKNGSSDELPFDLVPNDFFMFPLCYLLCRSRGTCYTRCPRRTCGTCRTCGARYTARGHTVAIHNELAAIPTTGTGLTVTDANSVVSCHKFPPLYADAHRAMRACIALSGKRERKTLFRPLYPYETEASECESTSCTLLRLSGIQ